ncbi:MAG: hypothetical protein FWG50_06545 [Kiritimatiellaeota bacterium]|nr:hypothetical protein [Kiritimatiellota bacterium]
MNGNGTTQIEQGEMDSPVVCQRCGKNDSVPLSTVAGLHVCPACAAIMNDFPFPRWVKNSAIGLFALVVFSAAWNLRYVRGIYEARSAMAALGQDDLDRAERLAYAAAAHVPEDRFLYALASYFHGIKELRNDNSKEAVTFLQNADEVLPDNFETWLLLRQALIGKAFDDKDYDAFLSLSDEVAKRYPEVAWIHAALASAYACKYAVTGIPEFHREALQALEKARSLPGFKNEYEQRILHRLETKEIISHEEFLRRFPDGWSKREEFAQ